MTLFPLSQKRLTGSDSRLSWSRPSLITTCWKCSSLIYSHEGRTESELLICSEHGREKDRFDSQSTRNNAFLNDHAVQRRSSLRAAPTFNTLQRALLNACLGNRLLFCLKQVLLRCRCYAKATRARDLERGGKSKYLASRTDA